MAQQKMLNESESAIQAARPVAPQENVVANHRFRPASALFCHVLRVKYRSSGI